jgi:gluconate 2-dehydrogenase gamma chain
MSAEETIRAFLEKKISRREFVSRLQAIGVTAGAALSYAELLANSPALAQAGAAGSPAQGPLALDRAEFAALEAIAGRILPKTETPGAIEAGAASYIDQALAAPYRPLLPRYRKGLAELDRHCRSAFGKSFAALGADEQDRLLEELEAGRLAEVESGAQFFELLRRHVMEGVFCEPYYGGNRDLVGWKLVNFPGQRYGYDDPYINRVIDLPPIAANAPPRKGG